MDELSPLSPTRYAERVRRVSGGREAGAGRAAVVLNAAAFWAAGAVDTLDAGVAAAEQSIPSRAAEAYAESLQSLRPTA